MHYENSLAFAQSMDAADPLRSFREEYLFPQHQGRDTLYFCGNSLGLQPRGAEAAIARELDRWQALGVEGHFQGDLPWTEFHKALAPVSAQIVGAAGTHELVIMNTLTVNLHLMMVTFYRPDSKRYKIIMEAGAFPSDQYAIESQVRYHGEDPETAIVEVAPRPGEELLRTEDIVAAIERHGSQTALVLFGGINYYTGQFYDIETITAAAHRVGAIAGFDLAHAAGNVPLELHDWNVDFAVWCTYKYLNSGPGALGGVFIHERHARNTELPRFAGWWGHNEERRFLMEKGFLAIPAAEGWQLSNAPILAMAPMLASHDLFGRAGMAKLRDKSILLTGYLEFLIDELRREGYNYQFITPRNPEKRGCQLSFLTGPNGKALFDYLMRNGVICDWREPNVIRIAPTPMYNSFQDVFEFGRLLKAYS